MFGSYLSLSNGITSDEYHEQLNWNINFSAIHSFLNTGEYKELLDKMPKNVNWASLADYETQDYTSASQEFACTSEKGCEVVDISPAVS